MLEIILIVLCIVILFGFLTSQYVKLYRYEIRYKNLPSEFENFRILHISDWHNRRYRRRIINLINNSKADIILVTGDMVQRNNIGYDTFLSLIDNITLDVPIYLVFGNHELGIEYKKSKQGFLTEYKKLLADKGAVLLDDEIAEFKKGNSKVNIYGLTVSLANYSKLKKPKVITKQEITDKLGEKKEFGILLAHTPESFEGYSEWGADLCLCGHNHGGIINIPFIGGLISAAIEIFPKYDKGMFKLNNSVMILSRGTGNNGCSLRFFNNPEIGIITLKTKK